MWFPQPDHPLRRLFAGLTEHTFVQTLGLADPHLTEIGLAVRRTDGSHRDVMAGSPISVPPLCATPPADFHDPGPKPAYMTGLGPGS